MAARYVKFLRGTPTEFEKLAKKNADTLYFITEAEDADGELYLGNKKIGGTDGCMSISLKQLKDVLISEGLSDKSLLMYDKILDKWISKSIDELFPIFQGATVNMPGLPGFVPAPKKGAPNRFLRSDGKWATLNGETDDDPHPGGIAAVDDTFFLVEDQVLRLKDLPAEKVVGLPETMTAVEDLFKALDNKVTKQEDSRLITHKEADKLNTMLGIVRVSADLSFEEGTLSFSTKVKEDLNNVKSSVSDLSSRVDTLEEAHTWGKI